MKTTAAKNIYEQYAESLKQKPEKVELTEEQQKQIEIVKAILAKSKSDSEAGKDSVSIDERGLFIGYFIEIPKSSDPIAEIGRRVTPLFQQIFESEIESDILWWIIRVPYEERYGDIGVQVASMFQTNRELHSKINWKRFKHKSLLNIADNVQWFLE